MTSDGMKQIAHDVISPQLKRHLGPCLKMKDDFKLPTWGVISHNFNISREKSREAVPSKVGKIQLFMLPLVEWRSGQEFQFLS